MGVWASLRALVWGSVPRWSPAPPAHVVPGARVRLRTPLASRERVWIPAGAAGIVVGWDTRGRQVSIELDAPRTVITVPWSWIEPDRRDETT